MKQDLLLESYLKQLRLPCFVDSYQSLAQEAAAIHLTKTDKGTIPGMIEQNEHQYLSPGGSTYEYTRTLLFRRRFLAPVCASLAPGLADLRTATARAPDAAASK